MKKLYIITFVMLTTVIAYGQQNLESLRQEKVDQLLSAADAKIRYHREVEHVKFIRIGDVDNFYLTGLNPLEISQSFMSEYGAVYGDLSMQESLELVGVDVDKLGFKHVRYRQLNQGVPVFDAEPVFHFNKANKLTAISGNYTPNISIENVTRLTSEQAEKRALEEVLLVHPSAENLDVIKPELTVFNPGLIKGELRNHHLCYYIEVRNDLDVREYLFIDAHTGKVVERFDGICTALDRKVYENSTNNLVWEEGDAFPGSLNNWQQNEVNFSEQTYNFFENAFGYTSYDGNDATMETINNANFLNCPNASWNGSTANYCNGTASDDVIGHEWGHAYTEYTNGLIYSWQSGALNESYSDIWGETIDQLNNSLADNNDSGEDNGSRSGCDVNKDLWKMGEQATGFSNPPIRDMWMPSCKSDPGEVSATEYQCGSGDSGGVHSNSGIPNHLYALLVDGGTYNGQTITAIGMTKAAHIFWRVQEQYLGRTSDFETLADALETACTDLLGVNLEGLSVTDTPAGPSGEIITTADCAEVDKAILAVELADDPSQCNFTAMLDETSNVCDGNSPEGVYFLEDWESGTDGWTMTQIASNPGTWESRDWYLNSSLPDSRMGSGITADNPANGDCNTDLENGIVRLESPVINISTLAEDPVELIFDHFVSLENNWDGGNIKYKLNIGSWTLLPGSAFNTNAYPTSLNGIGNNDNPLAGEEAFTGADGGSVGGSWGQSQVNLTSLGLSAGDSIQFRWELGSDGCNGWDGWYVDDIRVYSCLTSAVLPVEFLSLDAEVDNENVMINWQTASELNNSHFEVQRRAKDQNTFVSVGFVQGKRNSASLNDYMFVDQSINKSGQYFYRLKQVDLDGAFSYSTVLSVQVDLIESSLEFFPNPIVDQLTVQIQADFNGELSIYDRKGFVMYNQSVAGGVVHIDMSDFEKGMYIVHLTSESTSIVKKIIKQ